jgi:hypothetical protein
MCTLCEADQNQVAQMLQIPIMLVIMSTKFVPKIKTPLIIVLDFLGGRYFISIPLI